MPFSTSVDDSIGVLSAQTKSWLFSKPLRPPGDVVRTTTHFWRESFTTLTLEEHRRIHTPKAFMACVLQVLQLHHQPARRWLPIHSTAALWEYLAKASTSENHPLLLAWRFCYTLEEIKNWLLYLLPIHDIHTNAWKWKILHDIWTGQRFVPQPYLHNTRLVI